MMTKDTIKKIYLYSIGIFWIMFFIFFRFIRDHPEYNLNELKSNVTPYLIFANIAFILLHLTLIIISIVVIVQRDNLSFIKNRILLKLKELVNWLFIKPLESIRDLIGPKIPGSGLLFCNVAEFVERDIETRSKLLVIVFSFLPRIFIALVFFIELVFYNKIEYFIYSLFLILIPLSWSLFVNLFTNFGERSIEAIQRNVKVIGIGEPESNGWYTRYKFQALPQFTYEPGELKEWADTWDKVIIIYSIGETFFKEFKKRISPYVIILTSSLYLLASIHKITFVLF